MEIQPYNNAYTFLVKSRSRQGHHMVDISANRNARGQHNGECSCEHYTMTCHTYWKISRTPLEEGVNRTRCDHIIACRALRLDDQIDRLVEFEKKPNELPPAPAPSRSDRLSYADLQEMREEG